MATPELLIIAESAERDEVVPAIRRLNSGGPPSWRPPTKWPAWNPAAVNLPFSTGGRLVACGKARDLRAARGCRALVAVGQAAVPRGV